MEQNGKEQDSVETPLMVTAARKEMINLFSERNHSLSFVSFPSPSTNLKTITL